MTFFPTAIIVGVDGTPASRHALARGGGAVPRPRDPPLHIAHVRLTSGTLHGRPMTPEQRERAESEGQQLLDQEREAADELGADVAGTHLRHGDRIDRAFADLQEELGAGLLVVGDSTSGSLVQRLTGEAQRSTGAVRRSRASVLVVRERSGMTPDS